MLLSRLFPILGLCAPSVLSAPKPVGRSTSPFDPTVRASTFDWNTPNSSSTFLNKRDDQHSAEWFNSRRNLRRGDENAPVVSKRTTWADLTGPSSLYSYPTGVSWGGTRLDAFYHDRTGNVCSHLFLTDGVTWHTEENLGGAWSSSFAASTWGSGSIFVYGHGTDGACWYNSYSGGWGGWVSLGGSMVYEPSTVTWGSPRSDIFVIAASDGECWHRYYNGGTWTAWESLGGAIDYAPHSSSWGVGHISIFVVATADGQCYHRMWLTSQGGWSLWEALGGTIIGPISSVSWLSNRIDIFARGTDHHLWRRRYHGDTNVWDAWVDMGITGVGFAPSVVQYGTTLVVFVVLTDGTLWRSTYSETFDSWSSWSSSGGSLGSQPSGVAWNSGATSVFGEGTDQSCQYFQ